MLLNMFVEIVMHCFQDSFIKNKAQITSIYEIENIL